MKEYYPSLYQYKQFSHQLITGYFISIRKVPDCVHTSTDITIAFKTDCMN